jgi:hypothetical protein
MSNVTDKLIAAAGGAAIGVGGTLIVQKLRKDAAKEGQQELLAGLAEKIDEVAESIATKDQEPAENIAYRNASAKVVNEIAQKPTNKPQKVTSIKPPAPEATDK